MWPRIRTYFIKLVLFGLLLTACLFYYTKSRHSGLSKLFTSHDADFDDNDDDFYDFDVGDDSPKIQPTATYAEENCPAYKDDMINVHFILHTHNDPGWLKTPEKYYEEEVRQILNNVYTELLKNASRKFVYSEAYFFARWWSEIDQNKKETVIKMVQTGQLEFVGGGWVQNDDALTHYTSSIDQLGYGLRTFNKMFGPKARPTTGWQIDCFGYSKEQASIFAQSGFVSEVIHRIPNEERETRRKSGQMEFMWQCDNEHQMHTHVLYDEYIPPEGFKFENSFNPVSDDITTGNLQAKLDRLVNVVESRVKEYFLRWYATLHGEMKKLRFDRYSDIKSYAVYEGLSYFHPPRQLFTEIIDFKYENNKAYFIKSYPTNHLFLIMGNDFVFKNAVHWFKNIDTMIYHGNLMQQQGKKMNFFYSNPTCYFKADRQALKNKQLLVKTGDFFPYYTNPSSFWTGFYSSRPTLKYLVRQTDTLLQTLEKFESFISFTESQEMLKLIRENLFVTLHHDAVTGTCKQHVADDYIRKLNIALAAGEKLGGYIISKLSGTETKLIRCPLIDIDVCPFSQTQSKFSVFVFNGNSKNQLHYVRIPVKSTDYMITVEKSEIKYQVSTVLDKEYQLPKSLGQSEYEILVPITVPAYGFNTLYLDRITDNAKKYVADKFSKITSGNNFIENEFYKITFDVGSGYLTEIENKEERLKTPFNQTYFWYENHASGVYMMRPTTLKLMPKGQQITTERRQGHYVDEIRQVFSEEATQTVRLYKGKRYAEIEWTVGPLAGNFGREVVTRFETGISNNGVFFTDANGRQVIERDTAYPFNVSNVQFPVSAKYFPLTAMTTIKDKNAQLTLIPDRPIGGASVQNGSLELLLHRKILNDDGAGMGEHVDEMENQRPIVVRGKFLLTLTVPGQATELLWRNLAKEMFYSPLVMFSEQSSGSKDTRSSFSLLHEKRLNGIHVLSLQKLDNDNILIRLENYLPDKKRKLSLKSLFNGKITKCQEAFITGDIVKSSVSKGTNSVTLKPMEIRAFICSIIAGKL